MLCGHFHFHFGSSGYGIKLTTVGTFSNEVSGPKYECVWSCATDYFCYSSCSFSVSSTRLVEIKMFNYASYVAKLNMSTRDSQMSGRLFEIESADLGIENADVCKVGAMEPGNVGLPRTMHRQSCPRLTQTR